MKHQRVRHRNRSLILLTPLTALVLTAGCGGGRHLYKGPGYSESGIASWYGKKFDGRQTANGEVYDMRAMTAAHRTLPFGTIVRVTNLENDRRVTLRINDRGPFIRGRIIDLSYGAAHRLNMVRAGLAMVRIDVLRSPIAFEPMPMRPYRSLDSFIQFDPTPINPVRLERPRTVSLSES